MWPALAVGILQTVTAPSGCGFEARRRPITKSPIKVEQIAEFTDPPPSWGKPTPTWHGWSIAIVSKGG
jgi:hypothetical protein